MILIKRTGILLFFFCIPLTFNCGILKHKDTKVKILRVTAHMPGGYMIEVRNLFKTVPWLCFCCGVSMRDGSFIPEKKWMSEYIKKSGRPVMLPLTSVWKSVCEWTFYSTDIIITDTSGVGQLSKSVIYYNRGNIPLQDTITIISRHCVNPCLDPVHYGVQCKDSLDFVYDDGVFYSLSENNEDTVDLVIHMYFENDSIYLCNEYQRDCYNKWKERENQK